MAFDIGFDFRSTGGYVTDPPYGVPVLLELYPHTYTNANGFSINAGWAVSDGAVANRDNTNDPRIAGINYAPTASQRIFTVDLSSGSAPGAGTYTVDIAVGDAGGAQTKQWFKVLDNTTLLIDGTFANVGQDTAADHYIDATLADVAATGTWTGATASKVFATTTCIIQLGKPTGSDNPTLAHFRLALGGAAQSVVPVVMSHYRRRRD